MIEPVLSPEEWRDEGMDSPSLLGDVRIVAAQSPDYAAKILALANAALPDWDERKISWAEIDAMHAALDETDNEVLRQFADALASYLPPRD